MEKHLLIVLFVITALVFPTLAYADHTEAFVSIPMESSVPGCEETKECYIPEKVSIDVGGEVIWTNDDTAAHTVTSGTAAQGPDGHFDSSLFFAGDEFSVSFDGFEPGTYPYFCMVHPWMVGEVTVQASDRPISETVKELGEGAGEAIKGAGETVGEAVEKSGEAISKEAEKGENVAGELGEGTKEVGEEIGEASQEIGSELIEAGSETREAGGCLIATATYGSELAPQVQQLREFRDGTLLKTNAGLNFMTSFNQFYYSFSPAVADYERQNPVFKEFLKLSLTPMLSSLSILNNVDIDSEQEMVGYGIAMILLNVAMYFGLPVFGLYKIYQYKFRK